MAQEVEERTPSVGLGGTYAQAESSMKTLRITAPFAVPNLSKSILLAKFFRALGDPTRLRIVQAVLEEEKNVTALVRITGAPQGRVSTHLACLRWCGYVTARREGRKVFYLVTDPRVRELVLLASDLVGDNLERIRTCTVVDRPAAWGRRREQRAMR
jgi:DNA-binding transcriptional ArsR family regulator